MAISAATVALIVAGTGFVAAAASGTKSHPKQTPAPLQRRTKDSYNSTSFAVRPTYGVRPLNTLKTLDTLDTPNTPDTLMGLDTLQPLQTLQPNQYRPGSIQHIQSPYNFYNDPYQVNSLADVVFNKKGKDLVLKDLNMEWATNIPVLQELIVGVNHIKEQYVEPISKGKFVEAGINALMASGETLDTISNPLKGLVLDGGSGFINGLGIGEQGRTQYDFDAEFGDSTLANISEFIVNMGAEVAIDPLNWLEAAPIEAGKKYTKTLAKTISDVTDTPYKKVQNTLVRALLKSDDYTLDAKILNDFIKNKALTKEAIATITEEINLINKNKILKSVLKLGEKAQALDDLLLNITPIGWTFAGVRTALKQIPNAIKESTVRGTKRWLKEIDEPDLVLNPSKIIEHPKYKAATNNLIKQSENIAVNGGTEAALKVYYSAVKENPKLNATQFLVKLKDKNLITSELFETYKGTKAFEDYYDAITVVAQQRMTVVKAVTDIDFVTKELKLVRKSSKNAFELKQNIQKIINPKLGINVETDLYETLANLKSIINQKDANIKKLKALKKLEEAELETASIKHLKGVLAEVSQILSDADITLKDLKELPETNAFHKYFSLDVTEEERKTIVHSDFVEKTKQKNIYEKQLKQTNDNLDKAIADLKQKYKEDIKITKTRYKGDTKQLKDTLDFLRSDYLGPIKLLEDVRLNRKTLQLDALIKGTNLQELDNYVLFEEYPELLALIKNKQLLNNEYQIIRKDHHDLELLNNLLQKPKEKQIQIINANNIKAETQHITNLKNQVIDQADLVQTVGVKKDVDALLTEADANIVEAVEKEIDTLKSQVQNDIDTFLKEIKERYTLKIGDVDELDFSLHGALKEDMERAIQDERLYYELASLGNLNSFAKLKQAMSILEEADYYYDIEGTENKLIQALYPDTDIYVAKMSQANTVLNIMDAYVNAPEAFEFIQDLAYDTNNTSAGSIFNALAQLDIEELSFNSASIQQIKNSAKSFMLFNTLLKELDNIDDSVKYAAVDLISGWGYKSPDEFIKHFYTNGELDITKLYNELYDHYNIHTHAYVRKNSDVAKYFGATIDESKLHDALYDIGVTRFDHENLIKRGAMPTPKDGDVFTHFDIETTGYDSNNIGIDQIVQISATKSIWKEDHFEVIDTYSKYAGLDITYRSKGLNPELRGTVFTEDFEKAIKTSTNTEQDVINDFLDFMDGTLVGHNSNKFDIPNIEARGHVDLSGVSKQDTLLGADKLFGAKEISDANLQRIAKSVNDYVQHIIPLQLDRTIQLIDKRVTDKIFDIARDLTDLTSNGVNAKTIKNRINNEMLRDTLASVLGTTKFSTEYNLLTTSELVNTVQALEPGTKESIVKNIREILTDVKNANRYYGDYIITADKLKALEASVQSNLALDIQPTMHLDAYVLMNGVVLDTTNTPQLVAANNFIFSNMSTKKLKTDIHGITWNEALRKRLDEDYIIPEERRNLCRQALDTLDDINTDFAAKAQASDIIAASDISYTQVARAKAMDDLRNSNATAPYNLSDRIQATVDTIHAEEDAFLQQDLDYGDALANLDNKVYQQANNEIAINDTIRVLELEPEQLVSYMCNNGYMLLVGDMMNENYAPYIAAIKQNEAYFKNLGLEFREQNDIFAIVPKRGSEDKLRAFKEAHKDMPVKLKHYDLTFTDEQLNIVLEKGNKIHKTFNELNGTPMTDNAVTTAHNLLYADNYYANIRRCHPELFYNTALDTPEVPHSLIRKGKSKGTLTQEYFEDKQIHYTNTMLGSIQGRRLIDKYYQAPLNHNVALLENTIKRIDSKSKYIQLVFNKDLDINSNFYKDLTDTDLLQMYNENRRDLTMVMLVSDKKGKPIVRTLDPTNLAQIKTAREYGAILLPKHESNKIIQVINQTEFNSKFKTPLAQFIYKYVIGTYKGLYLSTPGMIVRNINDIIVKNTVGGTIEDIPTNIVEFIRAFRDWNKYEEIVQDIIKRGQTLNKDTIADYFIALAKKQGEDVAKATRELFEEVHSYAVSNASAGLSKAQQELILQYSGADKLNAYEWLISNNHMLQLNGHVEHAGRLANYRQGLSIGLTEADALARTVRTHFDYGMKTKAQMYAEFVIPFITFPLYNLQYWVTAAFESPWLIEALIDASRLSLDVEEQTQYTLDHSQYLQSQINNGNIRIGDLVLKLNPSVYDAFNLVTNPEDQLNSRILTPIKTGVQQLVKQNNVSENDTNLGNFLDSAGLYPLTRTANVIKNVIDELGGDETAIDSVADVLPSVAKEYKQKYGARIGENFSNIKIRTSTSTIQNTVQSKTGIVTKQKYYPHSYTTTPKISKTAGRSSKRIPSTKRYYSSSYNMYNRWKLNRAKTYIPAPASPEALAQTFKNLYYKFELNPKLVRIYNRKVRGMYNTR